METVTKKTKSLKNAEKRRERSKVAARSRRGKESEIFNDLSLSLPIPENLRSGLDKASVMRLTLCDLKIKNMMETVFPVSVDLAPASTPVLNEDFDSQVNNAMGGFILVFSLDGDVIYASEGITTQLGICQYEIMGQSIFEFSHPCDHNDIRDLLAVKKGENEDVLQRSGLFRMKSTVTARGRNAHLRSGTFKVINCIGRIFTGNENDASGKWFVSVCEPLLHPSDVDIPLNKQTFLSKHTPDMKFEYVDESISAFMGYKPEDMLGKSIFDFHHATDGDGFVKSFKSLYEKGQNQTERYRFLAKGGGWVWIVTQATVIYASNSATPNSVVCIHFITSGKEEKDVILSEVQLGEAVLVDEVPVTNSVPLTKSVLSEISTNVILDSKIPVEKLELGSLQILGENDFIAELMSGPLLTTATCNTSKIFTPRTVDMNGGFLKPADDTLTVNKVEPDDLTYLAPTAGDDCVSLDIPLLEDLLATLDEADMEYSLLDADSNDIPSFDFSGCFQPSHGEKQGNSTGNDIVSSVSSSPVMICTDPSMSESSISKSPLLSPYQVDSPLSGGFLSSSELGCSPLSTNQIDDQLFSGRLEDDFVSCSNNRFNIAGQSFNSMTTFIPNSEVTEAIWSNSGKIQGDTKNTSTNDNANNPLKSISAIGGTSWESSDVIKPFNGSPVRNYLEDNQNWCMDEEGQSTEPTPSKVSKIVSMARTIQSSDNLESGSEDQRIFLLVPVIKRRASLSSNSSSSGSDNESNSGRRASFGKLDETYDTKGLNVMLSSMGLEVQEGSSCFNFSRPRVENSRKIVRKRNYAGSLLSDGPLSFCELTRQDCEVNAPLKKTLELLQGNELLKALEMEANLPVDNIV